MFISCLCVLELCLEKAPRCGEETRRDKLDDLLHLLVLGPPCQRLCVPKLSYTSLLFMLTSHQACLRL